MPAPLPDDFFRLVERASDLILIVREGRIAYANPAFAAALGYSRQELPGMAAIELAHPDERESVQQRIAETVRGETSGSRRRRLLRKDGRVVEIESTTFALEFGGAPAAVLMGRDLTEPLRFEDEQRRRDEEFLEMLRAMPGVVGVFALDGAIRYVNDELARSLGYSSPQELIGQSAAIVWDPDDRDATLAHRLAAAQRGELLPAAERRLRAKDGSRRLILSGTCTVVFGGQPARLSVGYDVTAQRESERRARAVFDSSPLAIAVTDEHLRVSQWNRLMQELMDWPAPGSGQPAEFRPESLGEARALAERARLHGHAEGPAVIGERGNRPDVPVQVAVAPLFLDPLDPPSGFVFMMLDLSEQERAREQLRAIFDASPQAIVVLDVEGNVVLWSGAAESILGRTAAEATGKPAPFLDAADGAVRTAMHRALSGEPVSVEASLPVNRGVVELNISFGPLRGAQGQPAGTVVLVADVTERRKLERLAAAVNAALGRAEAEWRETFDTVDAAVVVVDPETGTLVRMNRAAKLLAPSAAEVEPSLDELIAAEPWHTIAQALPLVRQSREPRLTNAEQSGRTWLVSLSPVKSWPGGGEPVIVLARDVSEFVALQDSLRKSEAMSSMGSLVAGVAHEVRNPLFAISATVDAMQSRLGKNPASEPFLDALRRELERLNTLMHDLLEYGKPTTARLVPEPLAPVVAAAVRACESVAQKGQVRLENAVAEVGEVPMDSARLTQVFQNLIDNAVRHSPAGSTVRIESRSARLGPLEAVEIRVLDHGPGFNPADLPRIFEPFFTRRRGGTGLGLSIVQRIAEQHGGVVEPRNRSEGGAIVSVRLPRSTSATR